MASHYKGEHEDDDDDEEEEQDDEAEGLRPHNLISSSS